MVEKRGRIVKLLVITLVFIFALSLRIWNINQMGRTWDESAYVELGYRYIELLKKRDFSNSYWYQQSDEPPLVRYIYGLAGSFDISHFDSAGKAIFRYDYTYSRLISAIASSLSAIFVVLIGWKYISSFVGATAGIIFAMLPFFLGLSQLATLESFVVLLFTVSVYSFLHLLEKFSIPKLILTGILVGLALGVKYTNILLVPVLIWIYLLWYFHSKVSRKLQFFNKKMLLVVLVSFIVFFFLWPMPWFHLNEVISSNANLRYSPYSVPEVFFGKLMLVPKLYYFIYFLITTPLLIVALFLTGLIRIDRKRGWILLSLLAWFLLPFIQSFYNFRQHGIRYIIEIYPPFSLIAAIGLNHVVCKITKKLWLKIALSIPIFVYMLIILIRITPYYLDYFNIVVGGTKNVYEKQLFQLGWWGQGLREAGFYLINNAPNGSRIGLAISPTHVFPSIPQFKISKYEQSNLYDYVVVNTFNLVRERFDDSEIKNTYKPIYYVKADGAVLVTIYKR